MDPFAAVQLVCSTSRHRPKSTKGMRFQLLGPPCSVAKEVYGWHCASPVGQLQVDDTVVRLAIVRPTVSADLWTASSDAHRLPVRCHLAAAPHSAQCLLLLYAGALIGSAHHQLRCTALCRWVMETMACTLPLTQIHWVFANFNMDDFETHLGKVWPLVAVFCSVDCTFLDVLGRLDCSRRSAIPHTTHFICTFKIRCPGNEAAKDGVPQPG